VPPTNGIIALIFGTRWLATLAGLAFFSHQVGGLLGVWLGGIAFVRTGSYDVVWWLSILFRVLSAVINLPIVEKPVGPTAAAPAPWWNAHACRWPAPGRDQGRDRGRQPRLGLFCRRSSACWPASHGELQGDRDRKKRLEGRARRFRGA